MVCRRVGTRASAQVRTERKPKMRMFRYLVAVVPLLGLGLAGCGGLLGSVEGTGLGGPAPTPVTTLIVSGRAYMEKQVKARAFVTGDTVLAGAPVTILEVTSGGAKVGDAPTVVQRGSGTTDANGNFSVSVTVPSGANLNGLWLVQVGPTGTPATILIAAFVPGSQASVSVDVSVASTLVAVRILPLATTPTSSQFLQAVSNLAALTSITDYRIRTGDAGGTQVNASDVAATSLSGLVAQLADEAANVVPTPHIQTIIHTQGSGG